ncbi:hypothetical protein [Chryseobacterium salipaludis]|nr:MULTISPECIES: hypothetical protein [Chryseobacterium]MCX3296011.1 hypothetical protein [Planobacterium sp. JC490]
MKKNDTLNVPLVKPRKSTVDFLLSFSKSIEVLKNSSVQKTVSKN